MAESSDPRTAAPQVAQLLAEPHWRTLDFISDLHLQPTEPQTVQAWRDYLQRSQADKTVERPIGAKENAIILK